MNAARMEHFRKALKELTERMREVDAIEHGERAAFAARQRCAHEVAEAVDRTDRGLFEGRDEKGARQVCRVMLHPVHPAANVGVVQPGDACHLAGDSTDASHVPRARRDERRRPVSQPVPRPP